MFYFLSLIRIGNLHSCPTNTQLIDVITTLTTIKSWLNCFNLDLVTGFAFSLFIIQAILVKPVAVVQISRPKHNLQQPFVILDSYMNFSHRTTNLSLFWNSYIRHNVFQNRYKTVFASPLNYFSFGPDISQILCLNPVLPSVSVILKCLWEAVLECFYLKIFWE